MHGHGACDTCALSQGDLVVAQGRRDRFYVLLDGAVEVTVGAPPNDAFVAGSAAGTLRRDCARLEGRPQDGQRARDGAGDDAGGEAGRLSRLFKKQQDRVLADKLAFLRSTGLFSADEPDDALVRCLYFFREREVPRGAAVSTPGARAEQICWVRSGELEVFADFAEVGFRIGQGAGRRAARVPRGRAARVHAADGPRSGGRSGPAAGRDAAAGAALRRRRGAAEAARVRPSSRSDHPHQRTLNAKLVRRRETTACARCARRRR